MGKNLVCREIVEEKVGRRNLKCESTSNVLCVQGKWQTFGRPSCTKMGVQTFRRNVLQSQSIFTHHSRSAILQGYLTSMKVKFGDVEVNHAFLRVGYESVGSARKTDVIVGEGCRRLLHWPQF